MEVINNGKICMSSSGYVHEGNEPPEKCPQCGVPGSKFIKKEADEKLYSGKQSGRNKVVY